MDEKEKPKRKRGRPRKGENTYPEKSVITKSTPLSKLAFSGQPKVFAGQYDVFDPKAVMVMDRKQRIFFIASLGGSQADCAEYVGISQSAITQSYREVFQDGKRNLKMRIRCAQLAKAFEGDVTMLKHLGIAHCEEQKDLGHEDLTKETLLSGIEILTEVTPVEKEEE